MKRIGMALCLLIAPLSGLGQSQDGVFAQGAVAGVLDAFHAAAAAADEEKYFAALTPDAVFLGTDATERWTREEFRRFARPYFAKGKAWTYKATARWITFAADRSVAWFDELLDSPHMGPCRGSGVLVATPGGWKIAQYNLSIPIPNDLVDGVTKRIAEYGKEKKKP